MADPCDREDLLRELDTDGNDYFSSGRWNNLSDIALSIGAIITSLIATVLASTHASPWLLALFAALPAACISAQRVIDPKGRAIWYFRHSARVRSLANSLKYADSPNVEAFAKRRGAVEEEMEQEWAHVGRPAATPTSRKRKKP
jgi:hypothetical protein